MYISLYYFFSLFINNLYSLLLHFLSYIQMQCAHVPKTKHSVNSFEVHVFKQHQNSTITLFYFNIFLRAFYVGTCHYNEGICITSILNFNASFINGLFKTSSFKTRSDRCKLQRLCRIVLLLNQIKAIFTPGHN